MLGPHWSTQASTSITPHPFDRKDKNGTPMFLAVTQLTMTALIDGTKRDAYGVGAMEATDPDMAVKSALAEALKKAGHQLGIGLYLWDEEARTAVEKAMKLDKATPAALKAAVYNLAREQLGKDKPTQAEVAKHFGVKPGELGEADVNRRILEEQGVL